MSWNSFGLEQGRWVISRRGAWVLLRIPSTRPQLGESRLPTSNLPTDDCSYLFVRCPCSTGIQNFVKFVLEAARRPASKHLEKARQKLIRYSFVHRARPQAGARLNFLRPTNLFRHSTPPEPGMSDGHRGPTASGYEAKLWESTIPKKGGNNSAELFPSGLGFFGGSCFR
jgi:hypothetical protein